MNVMRVKALTVMYTEHSAPVTLMSGRLHLALAVPEKGSLLLLASHCLV